MRNLILIAMALVVGCRTTNPSASKHSDEVPPKPLTQKMATERSEQISDVRYHLSFDVASNPTDFSGKTTIEFVLKKPGGKVFFDFSNGKINRITALGKAIDFDYDGSFIWIDSKFLQVGVNQVLIDYTHRFSTTGNGLYRYVDPEDQKVYIYSNFEPYDANKLFPCFDQPNLKATYTLEVVAQNDWTVISSTREKSVTKIADSKAKWIFPESAKFSPYLISLHAGPYHIFEGPKNPVPLRLFARQSLAKYVDAKEWFKVSAAGFNYFNSYFKYKYPFKKYDQIIVPDFNSGAMENVASVTFSERYIKRGQQTVEQRESLANTILHEMAHMWFGNLVTMKWWNDLWLNESFATYMAAKALVEATEYKKSWLDFHVSEKQWGYYDDQLVTTHPIEAEISDTDEAFSNFDGITYAKGASVMNVLSYLIGPDKFREGVSEYFKKHEFGNTELKDFIGSLATAAKKDLTSWQAQWLQTAGLNGLKPDFKCEGGKVTHFQLIQSVESGSESFRVHKAEISLFSKNLAQTKVVAVVESQRSDVKEALGKACPSFVFINSGDHDYVKTILDEKSQEFALTQDLGKLDPLTRAQIMTALWGQVQDGSLAIQKYAELALKRLEFETETKIQDFIHESILTTRGQSKVAFYLPEESQGELAFRDNFLGKLEKLYLKKVKSAPPGSDAQKIWFDRYVLAVRSSSGEEFLKNLLDGKKKIAGLELDQDRRWSLVIRLNVLDSAQAMARIESEKKRDTSNFGEKSALSALANRPDPEGKKNLYKSVMESSDLNFSKQRTILRSLFPWEQNKLRSIVSDQYFEILPKLKSRDVDFQEVFTSSMAPKLCTTESVQRLQKFLNRYDNLSSVMTRELKVAIQEDERCVKIRRVAR